MGCTEPRSNTFAMRTLSLSLLLYAKLAILSSANFTFLIPTIDISPEVKVPVLSKHTRLTFASASKVRPPLISMPLLAIAPIAAMYTKGDMTSAHGAAADKNANERYIAPPRPKKGTPSTTGINIIVAKVINRIILEYLSPTSSINRLTRGLRCCALSVSFAILAGVLFSEDCEDLTINTPSIFIAPAGISSPILRRTGKASPVMC